MFYFTLLMHYSYKSFSSYGGVSASPPEPSGVTVHGRGKTLHAACRGRFSLSVQL